ncbi:eukaryotic translation initiation factor 4E-binding protein 2-like [Branchiostoma floridae]|uniref:Eukaryotic translation initiation factor 4E-binding protein 2-like n=1 Tax=Branchiostoma floridae TaxID=7739 RepID=A0A9J7MJE2_BRAFL|nr:eukaryotic translation initiation factor 4E-binding protein 2-like [Branchiostoma floridae]
MSAPRKLSNPHEIPTRRILISDPSDLPLDYGTTPGGTIFSTTPGGTRIIYDRAFLMQMRNSPHAKTPPRNLPKIPGVTSPADAEQTAKRNQVNGENNHDKPHDADEPQFEMDI